MKYWRINTDSNARNDVRACDLWYEFHMAFAGDFAETKRKHDSVFLELSPGDGVFMHHNGLGVVGYGIVKEEWNRQTYTGAERWFYKRESYEYRIAVDWDAAYDCRKNPLPITDRLPYMGTCSKVDPRKWDIESVLNDLSKRTPIKRETGNMNAYLFVWKKWDWIDLEQNIEQLLQTGKVTLMWSCISHKSVRQGDRAFLIKLGKEPRGIMAAGFISSAPFLAKHWSDPNKMVPRVMIDFEVLLNPDKEPILSVDKLKQGNLAQQHWTPQSSGISIKPEITDELEATWFDFLTTENIRYNPFTPTEKETQKTYTEGTPNQVTLTRYERNPFARKQCIEHWGLSCIACNFNFEQTYGTIGEGLIHVHHLQQVATVGNTYEVDPIKDLRPVCANCHAIIHRTTPALSIEEVVTALTIHSNRPAKVDC